MPAAVASGDGLTSFFALHWHDLSRNRHYSGVTKAFNGTRPCFLTVVLPSLITLLLNTDFLCKRFWEACFTFQSLKVLLLCFVTVLECGCIYFFQILHNCRAMFYCGQTAAQKFMDLMTVCSRCYGTATWSDQKRQRRALIVSCQKNILSVF